MASGAIPYLTKCMNIGYICHNFRLNFSTLLTPTIRTVGNLLTGDDSQTDYLVSTGVIENLKQVINHEKKAVRREACWALSNITAGNSQQIAVVLSDPHILTILEGLILNDSPEISREATWILSNATSRADNQLISSLVNWGLIKIFLQIMKLPDSKQVSICLDALVNIFNKGEEPGIKSEEGNPFLDIFEKNEGAAILEELQIHPVEEVYQKALGILETYYDIEEPLE